MKNVWMMFFAFIFFICTGFIIQTRACTDFRINAKDGTILITRSLEYALDFKSNLRTSPRGRVFNMLAPDGTPGMNWKTKYGYVYLDAMNIDIVTDGMNEKGLSFEALYLPFLAQYQTVPDNKKQQAIPYFNIGDYILGNFDSIEAVRQAISNVYIYTKKISGMEDMIFPLHFAVYEASGKGIVIEYINGQLKIYDNKIGVMTNSPSYEWHMTNLNNYIHLLPVNPAPVVESGVTFFATGQGFGMIGIPGDISPPSRFVKMATMLRVVMQPNNAPEALNLAEHMINNVDIPRGLAREPDHGNFTTELTQWVVFKDLTHLIFYYRTYDDLTLRALSLSQLNFSEKAPRLKMPINQPPYIQDVTAMFLKSLQ